MWKNFTGRLSTGTPILLHDLFMKKEENKRKNNKNCNISLICMLKQFSFHESTERSNRLLLFNYGKHNAKNNSNKNSK